MIVKCVGLNSALGGVCTCELAQNLQMITQPVTVTYVMLLVLIIVKHFQE